MKTAITSLSNSSQNTELLNSLTNSFLTYLRTLGYAERTLCKKKSVIASFLRWTMEKQFTVDELNDSHLSAFVDRFPQRQETRIKFEISVLRPFLKHIGAERDAQNPPILIKTSNADNINRLYIEYLRKERGLAENSILVYSPLINDFISELAKQNGSAFINSLDAKIIQNFLLNRISNRSSEYARLLATALRSFLRFLYLYQKTTIDLSPSVPMVRRRDKERVHGSFSPEEVEHVLSTIDLSIPRGRRDKAILLLLARLGLRAGEVVSLELDDILWRSGEIIVRGKGHVQDRLPLLSDIGESLGQYLHQDRGTTLSRKVFLRMIAPRIGLAGPGAVGHIVRFAVNRAGLRFPSRGAAHFFRHSLATKMICHGASIAEISEILRHRSQSSTLIYAKVDFETLRGVARPWPVKGGK